MPVNGLGQFVDQISDYVFVALMQDLTLDEIHLAKSSFKRHAHKGGVTINSYHADNTRNCDELPESSQGAPR
jgi:hypothetical protein